MNNLTSSDHRTLEIINMTMIPGMMMVMIDSTAMNVALPNLILDFAVTVSTNMAGRGVDIRLGGGNPEKAEVVAKLGGLYVIGTYVNESVRIDDQLRGRSGRQGDPGASVFFVSLEDE
ncbi:hypothetical protein [Paenibacillus sp. W2I17]|uniref:preprotein translocase subunit SecA n=1 Tax=Paenibacillus sp. W2I17 TaxID=3042311 RepID=UPI002781CC81|nr:hypothetical protein [Paenibacillus sp. W2I17]